jgi:TIR domain
MFHVIVYFPTLPVLSGGLARDKKMSEQIFICYRRDESSGWAGRLKDRLEASFPKIQIFMDVDLAPGVPWMETIKKRIRSCDVFIVVIGKGWASNQRLATPDDVLRIEICAALNLRIRVIPVLVDGAEMPEETQLPTELQPLVSLQAIDVRHKSFREDSERLIRGIEDLYTKEPDKNRSDAGRQERNGPSLMLPRERHAPWRAELVSKTRAGRTIQVTLSNVTHLIDFAVSTDIIHPQVIRVDGTVVAKGGSALTWKEELEFRIYDGDIAYTAVIKAKPPFHYRQFSMCKLQIDGRLLYAD